ncbi:MAG: hypothetical protein HUU10_04780 [Bacteroidetes bacterium]|nr:hypothetical protein [Bacteroidota bacterium]
MWIRNGVLVWCLLFPSVLPAQSWWFTAGLGISRHEFYELTDFLSGFGEDLSSGQQVLTLAAESSWQLTKTVGLGLSVDYDLAGLNSDLDNQIQTYTYQSVGVVIHPFYRFSVPEGLLFTAGPELGYQFFYLETTGVAAALPSVLEARGYQTGLRADGALKTGESMNIHLAAGLRVKQSDSVQFGNSDFTFRSLDAWVRFGVLFDLSP